VTFCGYVPAPAAHPRRRAVEALARCTRLDPLIVERGQFWGGTAGDRSSEAQRVRREYAASLAAGEYALCVRGAGNFSFRLYEALSCGRIPVFVDTDCVLPDEDHVDWRSLCVYVDESELPRLEEAVYLNRNFRLHSMIDISDGLSLDLGHILEDSGVGAVLYEEQIPVSRAAYRLARRTGKTPLRHALSDGEDYELLFTLSKPQAEMLLKKNPLKVPATMIGHIRKEKGLFLKDKYGKLRRIRPEGYEHL